MLSNKSTQADFVNATENALVEYCANAPTLSASARLRKLSDDVVVKTGFAVESRREYENQRYAWRCLDGGKLCVPRPLRYLEHSRVDGMMIGYIFMEYVDGLTLEELPRAHAVDIIPELADAIHDMQNRTRTCERSPSPIFGGLPQGFPWGPLGCEMEFTHMADLECCLNRRLAANPKSRRGSIHFRDQTCVLVHGDIVPRNIIMGRRGITLLDWERSSFYPPIVETAAIYHFKTLHIAAQGSFFDGLVAHLNALADAPASLEDLNKLDRVQVTSIKREFLRED